MRAAAAEVGRCAAAQGARIGRMSRITMLLAVFFESWVLQTKIFLYLRPCLTNPFFMVRNEENTFIVGGSDAELASYLARG